MVYYAMKRLEIWNGNSVDECTGGGVHVPTCANAQPPRVRAEFQSPLNVDIFTLRVNLFRTISYLRYVDKGGRRMRLRTLD